ncbi:helix-turn-helix transcriptional regulator [Kamptonema animale CS-326]|jgi:transcriptional regulator with XRE-family HTH domain|uniref:helix-turn-helix transcriptional regulator n=1 Tax=Kamptonema animale TaxID=92934 RepID=UPI00232D2234|nr:helix-turn-helix transcriptional regulator [Kamptonema animale]MDB9515016.1 helix-turn-helix transcriptional regulator [Kamptonema animale CS-326]
MSLIEYVGGRIRDLRTSYGGGEGLSQEALAKALGITANTISRWETATYRPTIEDLERLSRFFGVSILQFFPPEETSANDQITALLRTAKQLSPEDLEELRQYAEFRKARSLYPQGSKPKAGRKRKKTE